MSNFSELYKESSPTTATISDVTVPKIKKKKKKKISVKLVKYSYIIN